MAGLEPSEPPSLSTILLFILLLRIFLVDVPPGCLYLFIQIARAVELVRLRYESELKVLSDFCFIVESPCSSFRYARNIGFESLPTLSKDDFSY